MWMFSYSLFYCSFIALLRQDIFGRCRSLWIYICLYEIECMCAVRRHSIESVPVKYFRDHYMSLQGIIPEVGNRALCEYKIPQIYSLPLSCFWKSECSALKIISRCHKKGNVVQKQLDTVLGVSQACSHISGGNCRSWHWCAVSFG